MDLTKAAIANNRVTWVALICLAAAGLLSFYSLPRNKDPGFVVRWASVVSFYPGASPERMEQLVSDKLEKAIQEMPEVKNIFSLSKTGTSIITLQVKADYKEMRPIWDELRRKAQDVRRELPEGLIGPMVYDDAGDVFGVVMTITGDGFTDAELEEVAEEVRDELLHIPEVARVQIYGAQNERIFVEYNNARLAELGLSQYQLLQILSTQNIINPGGQVLTDRERIVLEPTGNFESVEEVRRTVIQLPRGGQLVYLEDIATVRRGYVDPPATQVRASGQTAIGLGVSLREGGNISVMGKAVRRVLADLEPQYPIGIAFDVQFFLPDDVDKTIDGFVDNLLQAVAIVLGVMLLTLGLRTGLVVASLIPMAILAAFVFMQIFGIGLDQVSLASLIIALGLLVDNAIVMSESIVVLIRQGHPPVEAAVRSAKELRTSLLVSSLTTAAAFLPIFLAKSETGEYTAPIFKVVTITLLCSWVLSSTMTTLFCVQFLGKPKKTASDADSGGTPMDTPFYRGYRWALLAMLRHRVVTVVITAAVFVVSMAGFAYVPKLFFPVQESTHFYAKISLPEGTPIERTAAIAERLDTFVAKNLVARRERPEGITKWATFVGGDEPVFSLGYQKERSAPGYAMTLFTTTSNDAVDPLIEQLNDYAANDLELADAEATFSRLKAGPAVANPIQIYVWSRDTEELFDIVDGLKARLESIDGTLNVGDDWGPRTKKWVVHIDQARARKAGVTSQDIATSLQSVLSGMETTQFREADKVIPIILRSVAADRQDIGKIETLNVYSRATGRPVSLKQVADLELVWEPAMVYRRNGKRTVSVKSDLLPGATAAKIMSALRPWLAEQQATWSLGSDYLVGGEDESSSEANESIMRAMPLAMFIILVLLVSQFNSMRRTFIIITTILLGMIGVVAGLLIMRSYFGFMTLLGIVSLAGIVINNAIVLLDRIRIEIETNGLNPSRAVVQAAQRRIRPILLTTATTIGGLIPLYLGGGAMWEPMAVAIMFGLMVSTVLTLGIVPVLYSLLFGVRYRDFVW